MRRHPLKRPYASEAELCGHVREAAEIMGFDVYPEAGGADLLMVAKRDISARWSTCRNGADQRAEILRGDVILVEAKLRACPEVLAQARWLNSRDPQWHAKIGRPEPNYRAIAVPTASVAWLEISQCLNIAVLETYFFNHAKREWQRRSPETIYQALSAIDRRDPDVRIEPPPIKVETPAGVPCPRRFSTWKLNAVRLALRLRAGELMTSKQIKEAGISMSHARDWVIDSGTRDGRFHVYRLHPDPLGRLPDERYPEIVEALRHEKKAA